MENGDENCCLQTTLLSTQPRHLPKQSCRRTLSIDSIAFLKRCAGVVAGLGGQHVSAFNPEILLAEAGALSRVVIGIELKCYLSSRELDAGALEVFHC